MIVRIAGQFLLEQLEVVNGEKECPTKKRKVMLADPFLFHLPSREF